MVKSVEDSYPELWHYTTAGGLMGILKSQQLWATNLRYLNDSEEFTGFFDRRLLGILKIGVMNGIAQAKMTPDGMQAIVASGGDEKLEADLPNQLLHAIRTVSLQHQAYVASFCYTRPKIENDGLLGQWRGYGSDGGYAVVFDTRTLVNMMHTTQARGFS